MVIFIRVKKTSTRREFQRALSIRLRVFVAEQGVPREIELDAEDPKAAHFLAYVGVRAVGTARVLIKGREAKVGRMAVLKSYRRQGIGRMLLKRSVSWARRSGVRSIFLNAQVPVISFYEKLGFRCVGRRFIEAGIPHSKMVFSRLHSPKILTGARNSL